MTDRPHITCPTCGGERWIYTQRVYPGGLPIEFHPETASGLQTYVTTDRCPVCKGLGILYTDGKQLRWSDLPLPLQVLICVVGVLAVTALCLMWIGG